MKRSRPFGKIVCGTICRLAKLRFSSSEKYLLRKKGRDTESIYSNAILLLHHVLNVVCVVFGSLRLGWQSHFHQCVSEVF